MNFSPEVGWENIWNEEATELCSLLRWPLVGGSKVSVLCFQPWKGGRLVYLTAPLDLDEKNSREIADPAIALPQITALDELIRPYFSTMIWESSAKEANQALAKFIHSDPKYESRMGVEEKKRYKVLPTSDSDYRSLRMFSSPLNYDRIGPLDRFPQLGVCYTIGTLLADAGNRTQNAALRKEKLEADPEETTNRLLFLGALLAGNRVLDKRLRVIFKNPYEWAGESNENAGSGYLFEPETLKLLYECKILKHTENWDKAVYLTMRLVLAHHLFYPTTREALQIFSILNKTRADGVLDKHSWPRLKVEQQQPTELNNLIEILIQDIGYLVRALVQWNEPRDHPGEQGPMHKFRSTETDLVCQSLALLCGEACKVRHAGKSYYTISPPKDLLTFAHSKRIYLQMPGYAKGAFNTLRETSKYFMGNLSPVNPYSNVPDLYAAESHSFSFAIDLPPAPVQHDTHFKYEWLSKYVRARVFNEMPSEFRKRK